MKSSILITKLLLSYKKMEKEVLVNTYMISGNEVVLDEVELNTYLKEGWKVKSRESVRSNASTTVFILEKV